MATKKKITNEAELATNSLASVEYLVATLSGYVGVDPSKVDGKSEEEIVAWLDGDEYLSRIGAHEVIKVTRETVFKRTL